MEVEVQGRYSALEAPPHKKALGAVGVAVLLFAAVAGGPNGIEPAVGAAGALPTLVALVLVALSWACTQALVVAELSTLMPSNAGYIVWVLRGLGPRAGFVNAWVCVLQQLLNVPLYAVLACTYLEQVAGPLSPGVEYSVKLATVALAGGINVVGTGAVERVTGFLVVMVQTPFVALPIVWAARQRPFVWAALGTSVPGWSSSAAVFLSTVCWNLQGWPVIGNLAAEVKQPARDIPLGTAVAVFLVTLNYVWPLLVTMPISPPDAPVPTGGGAAWGPGYFIALCSAAAPELGYWAATAAILSSVANFIPQLATSSRALQAVARMRMIPLGGRALSETSARFGTPVRAIACILACVLGLMALDFSVLVTTQVLLALVALLLQFAAFVRLKYVEPLAPRPYAVPGGVRGAWVLVAPFALLAGVIFYANVSGGVEGWASCAAVGGTTLLLVCGGELWARKVYSPELLAELGEGAGGGVEGEEWKEQLSPEEGERGGEMEDEAALLSSSSRVRLN